MRPLYARLFESLAGRDMAELRGAAQRSITGQGVTFNTGDGLQPFIVDPIPRLIDGDEWQLLSAAIIQRVRALNLFVCDVYGEREIVEQGIVPASAIESCAHFEPDLAGSLPPSGVFTHLAGLDLVRGADGVPLALEDNLRSPSGLTFALAARRMSARVLPDDAADLDTTGAAAFTALGRALRQAAPEGVDDPQVAIVSDGPRSGAWYEHQRLAHHLDVPLYSLSDVELHRGAVYGRGADSVLAPIDVIYRRTEGDRLRSPDGRLTGLGELLLDPILDGRVASVNAFGSGVADDKLTHAYVERIIEFYLGEQPLIRSVKTYDPSGPETKSMIAERAGELVFKPRSGLGGAGVTIGPLAGRDELDSAMARLTEDPLGWVVQETVSLSTHPTIVGDSLEPRRIDLRPYAVHGAQTVEPLPVCLTRVALQRGGMIVNSSRNGGAKDTWITDQ